MWVIGNVLKPESGRHWAVEIPILGGHTQGRSKKDAYRMAKDLVESMADDAGFALTVKIVPAGNDTFFIGAEDNKAFVALILRRQRAISGFSLRELAKKLGATSKNAYARYEQGRSEPSVSKLDELLQSINPDALVTFSVVEEKNRH